MTIPAETLTVAARAMYEATMRPFLHIQSGRPVGEPWEQLTEHHQGTYLVKVRKALESETFADYYAFLTLPERLLGPGSAFEAEHGCPPEADEDTERTRGHRAEYHLVQHLLRVDDGALLTGSAA
ncbi:hypothetical protein ACIQH0_32940 [Streptomyces griseus]|uniref:hypothetical protein n=1 Tax=Streptomyces griseus TaxID=1911 RepID=UPI0037F8E2DD